MIRAICCAVLALLAVGGFARAEERTMHFDNLVLKYDFPARFEYVGRDEEQVYFSDGEAVIEFSWRYLGELPDDIGAALLEEIETYPTYGRVDGYFRDGLEFEVVRKDKYDVTAVVRWSDSQHGYERITYATTTCCDSYLRVTLEYPSSADTSWLQDFFKTFVKGEIAQYDTSHDYADETKIYPMKLPEAQTPPKSEAHRLYDACSYSWNKHLYGALSNAKAIGAYIINGEAWCRQVWGQKSEAAAWEKIQKSCDEEGVDCYRFAMGDELSDWADEQLANVKYGDRDDDYREAAAAKERKRKQLVVRIDNQDRFDIGIAFYSSTRKNYAWPSTNRHWVMDAGEKREFSLACEPGEKICYGAARKNNNNMMWGVGLGWSTGCQQCCMSCGGEYGYNLLDGGAYRAPQVAQRSSPQSGGNGGAEILGSVIEGLALGLGVGAAIQNSSPAPAPRGPKYRQSDISGTK